jgi:solute carrier family 41
MWKLKIDPDNSTIPYLTSLGDLIGSVLLAAAFFFLRAIGHEYNADIKEINGSKFTNGLYNWITNGYVS